MQEIVIIFLVAIITVFLSVAAAVLGIAVTECFIVLNYLPEWTWSLILLILIVTVMRGLRYSVE